MKSESARSVHRAPIVLAIITILVYYFPYFYFGENAHILIHDNLDSNLSWVKILLDSGMLFSSPGESVNQVLNGIPRFALYGNYDIGLLWFYLFGMYWGYVVNKIIMSLVAFVGMYFLLRKYILPKYVFGLIPVGVALLFSLLPFWSFTLSVCGLPMVSYAFLGIRIGEKKLLNWLIIIGFTFYSSLILSGIFFISILAIVFIYDLYKAKRINFNFLIAIGLLCFFFVLSHYPLFYGFFSPNGFISHRTSFNLRPWSLPESIKNLDTIIRFGQYHAHSLHTYMLTIILPVLLYKLLKRKNYKRYALFLVFIIVTSLLYAIIRWEVLDPFFKKIMSLVPIQLQRFHFLHPMVWYLLLGLSLLTVSQLGKLGKVTVSLILLFQLGFIISKHELITQQNNPTYKQFYAESLFHEVKKFIARPPNNYRVISLGVHPSIAQYNGLYTLDGYFPNYPLKHKQKFKSVIAEELEKNSYLKYYYNDWGSRCYAFTRLLRAYGLNPRPKKIQTPDFDFKALKKMGGIYLLSSAEIDTKNNQEIELLHVFEHDDSYWRIFLYQNIVSP